MNRHTVAIRAKAIKSLDDLQNPLDHENNNIYFMIELDNLYRLYGEASGQA